MFDVSVIIPTYNRADLLQDTLDSLVDQRFSAQQFEVIVVDDGSTDHTPSIQEAAYPYRLRYFRQTNQGDAAARNLGASHSESPLLVFLDDDVIINAEYLFCVFEAHQARSRQIVIGQEILWLREGAQPAIQPSLLNQCGPLKPIPFSEVCSNNMSVKRQDYFEVGLMDALGFSGSSIWCDVEFSYRARLKGYAFFQAPSAVCWHRDHVSANLSNQKERMWQTAYRAAALFTRHPELSEHLPMFEDKLPIDWERDSARLVLRKLLRRVASNRLALSVFEGLNRLLPDLSSERKGISPLQRWIIGGHIYQGYHAGQQVRAAKNPSLDR